MNLLDLQREYNENQAFIKILKEKIDLIDTKIQNIHATDIKDISVLGHSKKVDTADLLHEKVKLEHEINDMYKKIEFMLPIIRELEDAYKKIGDRDKQIYIQRKIWGYSPVRIGIKWGIDERTVRRIVKKVEKSITMSENVHCQDV